MSLRLVEKRVRAFLKDTEPSILAICGKWGVGKTRFWSDTVKATSCAEESFSLPRYGYVSLFGIDSLENFKHELFASIISRESIKTYDEDFNKRLKAVGESAFAIGKSLSGKFLSNSASLVDSICFSSVRKTVICIDDLERRSPALELRDVLGLASLLKEERNCKVVFLLNDGEEGLEDFVKYHEKVVDIRLRFEPTSAECVNIAFSNTTKFVYLKECIRKLNITNIRTITKIRRVVEMVKPLIDDCHEEVQKQAMHTLALYSWCYYRADDAEIPTVEHVTQSEYARLGGADEDSQSEVEKLWNTRLREYEYIYVDDYDLALLKGIVDGYFSEDDLKMAASQKHDSIVAAESNGSFQDAQRKVCESFSDNAEEIVTTLFQTFRDNVKYLSPLDLNSLVYSFRELEEDSKANKAIECFIAAHDPDSGIFDLSDPWPISTEGYDSHLRDLFEKQHKKTIHKESLTEVLDRLVEGLAASGWHSEDEKFLSNCSKEDFVEVFKSTEGPQLPKYINVCLKFGQFSNSSSRQKQLAGTATAALKQLAKDSKLNQLRLKRFGISVDN